jgi:hypothetical protein
MDNDRYVPLSVIRALQGIEFPRELGLCERLVRGRLVPRGTVWTRTPHGNRWKLDLGISSASLVSIHGG